MPRQLPPAAFVRIIVGNSASIPRAEVTSVNKLLKSLEGFLQDRNALAVKTLALAKTERALIGDLGRLLSDVGYRLVPSGRASRGKRSSNNDAPALPKRLRCPRCDRRFSHPLPMARHMSATHGAKKTAGKTKAVKK